MRKFIRSIILDPRTKILFYVLIAIFLGYSLYLNFSTSIYAQCDRLETDKVHFELYRDDREVYKNVLVLLTEEQVRLGCIEK